MITEPTGAPAGIASTTYVDLETTRAEAAELVLTNAVAAKLASAGFTKAAIDALLGSTAITGALSTVADAPAKAVLTSIIAALVSAGIATNTTT